MKRKKSKWKKKSKWSIKKTSFIKRLDMQVNLPNRGKFYKRKRKKWNKI